MADSSPDGSIITADNFNPPPTARSRAACWVGTRNARIFVARSGTTMGGLMPTNLRLKLLLWWHWPDGMRTPSDAMVAKWNEGPLSAISPRDFAARLLREIRSKSEVHLWADAGGRVFWAAEIGLAPDARLKATRAVDLKTGVAHHEVMRRWGSSAPAENPKRWATLLNLNAALLYHDLNVSKIVVNAGLERGGYVWAKRGWMPIDGREWARVKRFVRSRYREIRDRLTPGDRDAVDRALGMDDPRAIDLLVRTETELINNLAGKEFRIASVQHLHFAQHLHNHDLDVFVVDAHVL